MNRVFGGIAVGAENVVRRLEYCTIMQFCQFGNFGIDVEGNHSLRQIFACHFVDLVLLPWIVIRTSESNQKSKFFLPVEVASPFFLFLLFNPHKLKMGRWRGEEDEVIA
jgi:hypothetical protein